MIKKIYYLLTHQILKRLNGKYFCFAYNFIQKIGINNRQIEYTENLFHIIEEYSDLYFTRPGRYRYYAEGIDLRLRDLFVQYCDSLVSIDERSTVIDCGANIGEFSLYCQKKGAMCIAFEPDPVEFKALKKNLLRTDLLHNVALWKENTTLQFNLANDEGDTSVDAGFVGEDKVWVKACRLDSMTIVNSLDSVKLLKLEAEGFEMEVLMGADGILDKVAFIAADLGPERGPQMVSPLPDVANFLISRGFKVTHFNPARSILLFKNNRI